MSQDFQLVYILGAGHSGSTLLNLLLNGHSQIIGLSEIYQLGRYLRKKPNNRQLKTDFWQDVKQRYEIAAGEPLTSIDIHWQKAPIWGDKNFQKKRKTIVSTLLGELTCRKKIRASDAQDFADWTQQNQYLFSCIAEKSGANILIDSSKQWQRLSLLKKSGCFNIKVIHLVRDGRAVVNSYIRKYGSFAPALRKWIRNAMPPSYLRREFEQSNWLRLHYEELASQPETTLRKLCDFLEVDYEPQMLHYRQHLNIGLRGNFGVNHRQDEKIVLDQKWKRELSRLNLARFTLFGGWLNTYYGY